MAWDMIRSASDTSARSYPRPVSEPDRRPSESRNPRRSESKNQANRPGALPSVRILVLGTGNVLLADEGIGARVIEALRDSFVFSENVGLIMDRTLGLGLLDVVTGTDALIVVGAYRMGGPPGTLYRLKGSDPQRQLTGSNAAHGRDLAETLQVAEILGKRPETVILGIEPEDTSRWSTWLTEAVECRVADLVDATLQEVGRLGGEFRAAGLNETSGIGCEAVLM